MLHPLSVRGTLADMSCHLLSSVKHPEVTAQVEGNKVRYTVVYMTVTYHQVTTSFTVDTDGNVEDDKNSIFQNQFKRHFGKDVLKATQILLGTYKYPEVVWNRVR